MVKRRYVSKELQRVYDHYRQPENAPYYKPEIHGLSIEWHGANLRNAYWCGRHNQYYNRMITSPLQAAYMAGKDLQKEIDK